MNLLLLFILVLPFCSKAHANWRNAFLPKPFHTLSGQCQNDTDTWIKSLEINTTVSVDCIRMYKCNSSELRILNNNLYAVQQLDAFGQFPASGLLEIKTLYDGSYQECQRISGKKYETNYCYLLLSLGKNASCVPSNSTSPYANLPLRIAVCLPYSCNQEDMVDIFNQMSPYPFTACEAYCVKNEVEKDSEFWGFSIFLLIMISLAIFSTVVDYIRDTTFGTPSDKDSSKFMKILLTFSLWTNAELILSVKEQKPGFIKSLDCIRFLSMCWVLTAHSFLYFPLADTLQPINDFPKHLWNHLILNAFVSVDTFFILSGIVVAYMFFKMKPNMKMISTPATWVLFYVHRYLRLTPPVMLFIGFFTVYSPYIQGSFLASQLNPIEPQVRGCYKYWWKNILYINNFDEDSDVEGSCYGITWYLAVDTQLFVFAPVFLVAFCYSFAIGTVSIVAGCAGSIIATYILFAVHDLTADGFGNGDQSFFDYAYDKPWIRCPPYLVGLFTGYLLATYGNRKIRLNWALCIVGWMTALGIAAGCLFATYDYDDGAYWSTFSRATFYNFHRLGWGIFICWVVGANHMGWGGPINNFMSHPIWQPFGRLSYCAYIVHWMILLYYLNIGGPLHYSSAWAVFLYISLPATILSYFLAFFWSCLFEVPILKLEKILLESIIKVPGRPQLKVEETTPGVEETAQNVSLVLEEGSSGIVNL